MAKRHCKTRQNQQSRRMNHDEQRASEKFANKLHYLRGECGKCALVLFFNKLHPNMLPDSDKNVRKWNDGCRFTLRFESFTIDAQFEFSNPNTDTDSGVLTILKANKSGHPMDGLTVGSKYEIEKCRRKLKMLLSKKKPHQAQRHPLRKLCFSPLASFQR